MTADDIRERLKEVRYPGFSRDIVSFGVVKDIAVSDKATRVVLAIVTENEEVEGQIVAGVERLLETLDGIAEPQIVVEKPQTSRAQQARQLATAMGGGPAKPAGVARVIPVASGKGGVGKSTVAANLAVALARLGYRVGLLDADIYGPSVPTMFGISRGGESAADGRLVPAERFGVKLVSMGFFVDKGAPLVWRGPMLAKALGQFLNDVEWGGIDYLVIDLPPGTGDVQMTLTQSVALDGAIIVTTPQDVALADVERGIKMFDQASTRVLGVVENMSYHICPGCGEKAHIFGGGGASKVAEKFGIEVIGSIPLERKVRESGDSGTPIVVGDAGDGAARAFDDLAKRVVSEVRVEEVGHA
jgi:ATP-binding protein involved in chromosome partitioning